jgi:hypothetical protein
MIVTFGVPVSPTAHTSRAAVPHTLFSAYVVAIETGPDQLDPL